MHRDGYVFLQYLIQKPTYYKRYVKLKEDILLRGSYIGRSDFYTAAWNTDIYWNCVSFYWNWYRNE